MDINTLERQERITWQKAYDTDSAWSRELEIRFGKRAGDIRYTAEGKGEPGSILRERHNARQAAQTAWHRAFVIHRHLGSSRLLPCSA